jgi:hypothetical protein
MTGGRINSISDPFTCGRMVVRAMVYCVVNCHGVLLVVGNDRRSLLVVSGC